MWQVAKMLIQNIAVKCSVKTYVICFSEHLTEQTMFPCSCLLWRSPRLNLKPNFILDRYNIPDRYYTDNMRYTWPPVVLVHKLIDRGPNWSFMYIKLISKEKKILPAFITFGQSSIYLGVSQSSLSLAAIVQNAVARLLTCTKEKPYVPCTGPPFTGYKELCREWHQWTALMSILYIQTDQLFFIVPHSQSKPQILFWLHPDCGAVYPSLPDLPLHSHF